jgi:hypothetical protein
VLGADKHVATRSVIINNHTLYERSLKGEKELHSLLVASPGRLVKLECALGILQMCFYSKDNKQGKNACSSSWC